MSKGKSNFRDAKHVGIVPQKLKKQIAERMQNFNFLKMKTTTKHCDYCETEFKAKRTDAKFCSGACKQNAYLDRIKTAKLMVETEKVIQKKILNERINELDRKLTELLKKKEAI